MYLTSTNFIHGEPIPSAFALYKAAKDDHVAAAGNRSPQLNWSGAPTGTRSFVLTCIDVDGPTVGDDVNQEGRSVPHDLPRGEFVHWLLAGLNPNLAGLEEGACSAGWKAGGKQDPLGPTGTVQGCNDYGAWFDGDKVMDGPWRGYDGPAPPWNDERLHHYHFEVSALDCALPDLAPGFTLEQLRSAILGHVLGSASLVGTYTQNPDLIPSS